MIAFGSSAALFGYGSKPNPDINIGFNFNAYSDPENRIAVFEITEAGEIDGGADGGRGVISGEALKADEAIYIEEGISLSIGDVLNDQGESIAYLAQGDQIEISTGEKLTYHFASQIQLDSAEEIVIAYQASNSEASADDIGNTDNKLGRLTFIGDPLMKDRPGDKELSLAEGAKSASLDHSLATTSLLTPTAIRDTIRTIDLSLDELNEDRSTVGAALNRVEQRSLTLSRKMIDLSNIHLRLTGLDLAQETALLAAEQIQKEMSPFLLNKIKARSLVALDLINRRCGGRF